MHEILGEFYRADVPDRFYAIKGMHGIGKTALVKQLSHYIEARSNAVESIFSDGVIYLGLKPTETPSTLLSRLLELTESDKLN